MSSPCFVWIVSCGLFHYGLSLKSDVSYSLRNRSSSFFCPIVVGNTENRQPLQFLFQLFVSSRCPTHPVTKTRLTVPPVPSLWGPWMEAPRSPNFSLGVFVASASAISKRGVSLPHLQAGGPLILDRELCPVGVPSGAAALSR